MEVVTENIIVYTASYYLIVCTETAGKSSLIYACD